MKKLLLLVFLMIIIVGCNSNEENIVKKFTSSEIKLKSSYPSSVKFTVLLTKYGNHVYTKVEMNFGKYNSYVMKLKMNKDFFEELIIETYYYDKNGIDLDDGDILDIQQVNFETDEDIIFEGQTNTEYDDNELFGFNNVEYIVIEYRDGDGEYRKTEKIKRSFFN